VTDASFQAEHSLGGTPAHHAGATAEVNVSVVSNAAAPFGGVKQSGLFGKFP
jgi:hypothetical protein